MDARTEVLARIYESGVIAVMRGVGEDELEPVAEALINGGVTALEVTAETGGAADLMRRLSTLAEGRGVAIGAGTVLDAATVRVMTMAGAEFVVSPSLNRRVIRAANRDGVPNIPGIMTPSEAVRAYEFGADAVKLFPAKTVGPDHLRAISGPFDFTVIPTGGISLENAADFLEAGATGIGVGGALLSDELIDGEQWDDLEQRAREFVDLVKAHRVTD